MKYDFRFSNIFKRGDDHSDNAMISIYPIGDEYYTLTEYPIMIRIDPLTLETLKTVIMYYCILILNYD